MQQPVFSNDVLLAHHLVQRPGTQAFRERDVGLHAKKNYLYKDNRFIAECGREVGFETNRNTFGYARYVRRAAARLFRRCRRAVACRRLRRSRNGRCDRGFQAAAGRLRQYRRGSGASGLSALAAFRLRGGARGDDSHRRISRPLRAGRRGAAAPAPAEDIRQRTFAYFEGDLRPAQRLAPHQSGRRAHIRE